MHLIYRHLLASARGPFFFGLSVITFLLMIETLFNYVDLFMTKGVSFPLATKVLLLSLPHTFALSIPMSVLVAVLMGVGQLAADNEITAMKANGISLWAVLRPLIFGAGVLAVLMTLYNHFVFPRMNHTLANLIQDIHRARPMLEIQPQQFTDLNEDMTIYVAKKDDLTGEIEDVTIIEKENRGDLSPRMTFAARGRIVTDHEANTMTLELYDGETHEKQDRDDPDKYKVIRFERHERIIRDAETPMQETERTAKSDREMDLVELSRAARRERANRQSVTLRVREQTRTVLDMQWRLLDAEMRDNVLGDGSVHPDPAERRRQTEQRFKESVDRVRGLATMSGGYAKNMDMYLVKENKYLVEFHKKFAIPFACVVFSLLGLPMAVTASRSGRGVSISLAIAVFLVYYLFLVGGEKMADRGRLDPMLAMWSANLVLLAIGIPVFFRTVKESSIFSITHKPKPRPEAVEGESAGR